MSAAHFVHVAARFLRGATAADASVAQIGSTLSPDGVRLGPLWRGPLHNMQFVSRALASAQRALKEPG